MLALSISPKLGKMNDTFPPADVDDNLIGPFPSLSVHNMPGWPGGQHEL